MRRFDRVIDQVEPYPVRREEQAKLRTVQPGSAYRESVAAEMERIAATLEFIWRCKPSGWERPVTCMIENGSELQEMLARDARLAEIGRLYGAAIRSIRKLRRISARLKELDAPKGVGAAEVENALEAILERVA
jgi:hypothetical protein